MRTMDIEKILPLSKVQHNTIVSMQGDLTVGFRLTLPDIFSQSSSDFEAQQSAWVKAIKVFPCGTVIHRQDWYIRKGYRPEYEGKDGMLSRSSERFFNERPYLEHESFVFLSLMPKDRRLSSSLYSNILRKSVVPSQTLSPLLFQNFMDCVGQFQRILSDSGFVGLQRLSDNELAGTANYPGVIEKYLFLLAKGQHSVIRDIKIKDGLKVGDQQLKLFTLSDAEFLPSLCGTRVNYDKYSTDRTKFSIGFASPLGVLLDCNHIYNQYLFLDDNQKVLKLMESKRLRLQSLSGYSRENGIARDAVSDFLNEAIGQQRMPVKAHFNILAWSVDPAEFSDLKNRVGSAMAQMDAVCKEETDGAAQIWFAGMPGNEADFPMNDTFQTFLEQACCFFNTETNYRSSNSPFGIRFGDRLTGNPVHVDISDEPMKQGYITNRNKFILGPSGSGKSFFTNHMVRSYYQQGAHIVLVDVGHSYKGLCDLVGGYYFTYSEKNPLRFNPFYLAEGDHLDTEKKESIKTLLLALWKKDNETYSRSEYVALSNALTMYYEYLRENKDVFPGFNSFYDFLMSHYMAVLKNGDVREKDFDIGNFLFVLNPYYKGGEFDYLLNATENLDLLHERFIVFELDEIKNHEILLPVVTIIIMETFISKMRKLKGIRKLILLEEVWKAISRDGTAEYIKYLFKTVRKFFGEAIVVTQEVEDIISSPIVKQAIINNSDCKILLDQSKYQNKFDSIQELLGLTDKEKAQILSMNRANEPGRKYKEVFISLGGQYSKVYRTEVSLEEYLCYTTEETEKVKVQEYAQRYNSIEKGIAMLAADMRAAQNKGRI